MREEGLQVMSTQLESLYLSGHYSDFVIVCGGQEFNVHKAIICPQSEFLKGLCGPHFKEGADGKAVLQDVDPTLFERVLRFLYTASYDETPCPQESLHPPTPPQRPKFDFESEGFALIKRVSTQDTVNVVEIEPGSTCQSIPRQRVYEVPPSPPLSSTAAYDVTDDVEDLTSEPALLLHIQMYVLADYLEIPLLKKESLDRFETVLQAGFNPNEVLEPFKYALENTHSVHNLRASIFRICSQNWQDVIECADLNELLVKEEPLTWNLLKDQEQRHTRRLDAKARRCTDLQDRLSQLEVEVLVVRDELDDCREAKERKEQKLDECVRLTRQWQSCRHCRTDFDAVLERHQRSGDFFLRCNRCQCKHDDYY